MYCLPPEGDTTPQLVGRDLNTGAGCIHIETVPFCKLLSEIR